MMMKRSPRPPAGMPLPTRGTGSGKGRTVGKKSKARAYVHSRAGKQKRAGKKRSTGKKQAISISIDSDGEEPAWKRAADAAMLGHSRRALT